MDGCNGSRLKEVMECWVSGECNVVNMAMEAL